MKIAFLSNYNLYESKRYFTQKFAEALRRKNSEVRLYDLENYSRVSNLMDDVVKFSPDITCSMNAIPQMFDGRYLWEWLQLPHLAMLLDPSIYYIDVAKSPYCITSCLDRFDCAFLKSLSYESTFFMPLAVERALHSDPLQKRPYDVVFLGSCLDYEGARQEWMERYPPIVGKILDAAIDTVLSDRYILPATALAEAIKAFGFTSKEIDFTTLFSCLDVYTRGRDRVELIKAIEYPKAKIHIFGNADTGRYNSKKGWEHYVGKQANVTIHPAVPFVETLEILKKSKIALNSMPFFKDGAHDRIFTGLACGALSFTSSSKYIDEVFVNGQELLTYQPPNWSAVNGHIEEILNSEPMRKKIVDQGRAKVMKSHTWDNRAEDLLKSVETMLHLRQIC